MRRLAALLKSPGAGAVLLALILAVSIGVPAVAAMLGDGGARAGDGPSVGVLSTAAIGGFHRVLLGDGAARAVHLDAVVPAALVVPMECDRPAGIASVGTNASRRASASNVSVVSGGLEARLRI